MSRRAVEPLLKRWMAMAWAVSTVHRFWYPFSWQLATVHALQLQETGRPHAQFWTTLIHPHSLKHKPIFTEKKYYIYYIHMVVSELHWINKCLIHSHTHTHVRTHTRAPPPTPQKTNNKNVKNTRAPKHTYTDTPKERNTDPPPPPRPTQYTER